MIFKGVMKVGDLVRLREVEGDPSSQRMGSGLVVKVEINPLDYSRRYPVIQVKFLKTKEILRFIEKDLMLINEA
jgi:hypothetical protein